MATYQSTSDLKTRTRAFAIDCVAFYDLLPNDFATQHFGKQLLRSSTSVAANYRAACRSRSNAELHAKLCICEEEADECLFWFDMIQQSNRAEPDPRLVSEANQLTAMFVSAKKRLRSSGLVREERATYEVEQDECFSPFDPHPSTL